MQVSLENMGNIFKDAEKKCIKACINTVNIQAASSRKEGIINIKKNLTLRNTWTERNIVYTQCSQNVTDITQIQSEVGATERAEYMERQEKGGMHKAKGNKLAIPSTMARGGANNKKVKPSLYLSKNNLVSGPTTKATTKATASHSVSSPTYISGILIANKTYALPSNYNPGVNPAAQSAFNTMAADAAKQGINLYIVSGFRSYSSQASIYNNYVARDGKAAADRYSARPGHSEHQTGLAFDVNSLSQSFENTKEGKWLAENCHNYGFIIRYPKGKESVTGYMYEPWHIRYVGTDLSYKIHEMGNNATLEEYFGIGSQYTN